MTGGNVLLASYTQSEHWVSVYDGGGGNGCVIDQQVSQKILAEEQILYQAARIPDITVHQQ